MEKAVIHHLLDEVVDVLRPDLMKIVAALRQSFPVIDGHAFHILHHKNTARRILVVESRAGHIGDALVVSGKLLHVGGFLQEIHLLLGNAPELIQDHVQIHQILQIADRGHQMNQPVQQTDVSCHDIIDALSLHLDDNVLTGFQHRLVHLRDGRRPKRRRIDGGKNLAPALAIGAVDDLLHHLKRHWRNLRIQLHQFVAVALRENVRVEGHDLTKLDIGRPQFLQNDPKLFRRNPSRNLVLRQHLPDFPHSGAIVCGFLRFLSALLFLFHIFCVLRHMHVPFPQAAEKKSRRPFCGSFRNLCGFCGSLFRRLLRLLCHLFLSLCDLSLQLLKILCRKSGNKIGDVLLLLLSLSLFLLLLCVMLQLLIQSLSLLHSELALPDKITKNLTRLLYRRSCSTNSKQKEFLNSVSKFHNVPPMMTFLSTE